MPYIKQEDRKVLDIYIDNIVALLLEDKEKLSGKFNYVITKIITKMVHESKQGDLIYKNKNYRFMNDLIGVLECVKQEFYRRVMANYEDYKCKENGDVY